MKKWVLWVFCLLLVASSLGGLATAAPESPTIASAAIIPAPLPEGPLARADSGETSGLLAASTLAADADTPIAESQPNANGGDNLALYVGRPDGQRTRILLDLPIWDLPPKITIQSATLRLCLMGWQDYAGYSRTIRAYRLTAPWHEALATWNRQPTQAEELGSVSIGTPDLGETGVWYSIDLTPVVRGWYNGDYPNYGLILMGAEEQAQLYRIFGSSETTVYPRLEVNYTGTAASLSIAPSAFTFFADSQGSAVGAQVLRISNPGSTPLIWDSRSGTAAWVKVDPITGTVGADSTRSIYLNVNTAGLAKGAYQGKAQISAPAVPAQSADVTLNYLNRKIPYSFIPLALRSFSAAPPAPSVAILLIGISDYEWMTSPQPQSRAGSPNDGKDLMYCDADSQAMYKLFKKEYGLTAMLQGLAPRSAAPAIKLLTESQASKADIRAAFSWLDEHEDANTLVIIGYSGHGGLTADDDGDEKGKQEAFICPYDTRQTVGGWKNIIRDDELDQLLSQLESRKVVVFLDTCFAASSLSAASAETARTVILSDDAVMLSASEASGSSSIGLRDIAKPNRVILAASRADQASAEFGALRQRRLYLLSDDGADGPRCRCRPQRLGLCRRSLCLSRSQSG